jgi:hypothetical protein
MYCNKLWLTLSKFVPTHEVSPTPFDTIILSVKKQSIIMIRYSIDTTETVGTAASNRSFVRDIIKEL